LTSPQVPLGSTARRVYFAAFGVSALGTGLAFPLTALYLRDILGVATHEVGLYFCVMAVAAMVVNPIAGFLADARRIRLVLLAGSGGQAAGALVLANSHDLRASMAAAVLFGVGNGSFFAVQTPMILRLFGRDELGRTFGIQYLWMNLAVAVAGATAGLLVTQNGAAGYRVAFLANSLTFAIFAVAVWGLLGRSQSFTAAPMVRPRPWQPYGDRSFIAVIFLQFAFVVCGFGQFEAVLPIVLHDSGKLPITAVALFLAANGITVVAFQPIATKLGQRLGIYRALTIAVTAWICSFGFGIVVAYLHARPFQYIALVGIAALFAIGETFIACSLQPLVVERAPADRLGSYSAAVSLMFSAGLVLGPPLGLGVIAVAGAGSYYVFLTVGIAACYLALTNVRAPAARPSLAPVPVSS
jgi:MFS family permease